MSDKFSFRFALSVLVFQLALAAAHATAPVAQNFESSSTTTGAASVTVGGVAYSTNGVGTVAIYDVTTFWGPGVSFAGHSGKAIIANYNGSTSTAITYLKVSAVNAADKFKLNSMAVMANEIESSGQTPSSYVYSVKYKVEGFSGGAGGTLVTSVSQVNLLTGGTYGTGTAAIVYAKTNAFATSAGNGGTLTFGSAWDNIDTVVFTVTDGAAAQLSLDTLDFSPPTGAPTNATIVFTSSSGISGTNVTDGQGGSTDLAGFTMNFSVTAADNTTLLPMTYETPYPGQNVIAGGYQTNTVQRTFKIASSSTAANFALSSISIVDSGGGNGDTLKIEGFDNGSSTGSIIVTTATVPFYFTFDLATLGGTKFQAVDEVRITESHGLAMYIGVNNLQLSFIPSVASPTITNITPSTGSTAGGTGVTINGTGFTGATVYTVGGVALTSPTITDTSITGSTGSHAAGAVDVVVTTPGGSVTSTGAFTYAVPPAPSTAVSGNGNAVAYQADAAAASTTNGTDFGSVPVAGGTQANTFTITNSGTAVLNLTGSPNYVTISPGAFSVTSQPSGTVNSSGGTTTFTITFDPSAAGAAGATVSFGSNDSTKNPFTFAITGTGSGPQTFDLAGNAISNTPYDGGESYICTLAPPPPATVFTAGVDNPPGATGTSFDSIRSGSVISSPGAVAFRGYLAIGGTVDANNYMGIWKSPDATAASTVLVARSGSTAPDSGSAPFDILPVNPTINNNAQTSFQSMLRVNTGSPLVTTTTDTGVWSEIGGTGLHLILREGDAITGGTTSTIDPSTWVATGDSSVAFSVKMSPTGSAIVRGNVAASTLSLATIALQGGAAPNVGGGTSSTFDILSGNSSDPRLDAAGDLAFLGGLADGKSGIWYQSFAGSLVAVIKSGAPPPGLADNVAQFERPTLANATTVAFRIITTTGQAVYKGNPNTPASMAPVTVTGYTNAQIPSVPAGSQLWSMWSPFSNAGGHIAYRVSLINASSIETRAILTDTNGTPTVIAKVGDIAPGTSGDTFVNFDHPIIGDGDQTAFTAATNLGTYGLWRQAAGGGALSLMVKVGDTFTINSVVETVASLSVPGSSTADRNFETHAMDAAGHIVVQVTYASGKTGLLLASP